MTVELPTRKHKELKAISAILGISMKDFILQCILEKLDDKNALKDFAEDLDVIAFDKGMKSIEDHGYDTLEEVKKYLGLDK
jgi:hypothetical protein